MNDIWQLLANSARQFPDDVALAAPGRVPLTYGQLATTVDDIRGTCRSMGIKRGDRVAVVLPNGPEMAAAFLAVAATATCAPLNPAYREQELEFFLGDLGARALLVDARHDSPARKVAESRGITVIELTPQPAGPAGLSSLDVSQQIRDSEVIDCAPVPDDTALVLHTSGTTSRPKLVPLTHANLCASARSIAASLKLRPGDRCLNVMPLFHIHGLVGATLSSIAAGASVACTPGFDPAQFFGWLDELAPTWYTGVPTMHQAIVAGAAASRDVIAHRPLRFIRSSSASLPPSVLTDLESTFGVPVLEAYGMTEASHQIATNPLPPGDRRPGSVGPAVGAEVAIITASGQYAAPNEVGEVVIRGPGVTGGYESNAAANEQAFVDGWLRTGDEGRLDDDGYLTLTARVKELVNRGGEKITPREVEEVLLQHPAVGEAAVFATPHPRLGEDVAAAIVLRVSGAAAPAELRRFAAQHLADFKVPRRILLLDAIPKGPTGKLARVGLAARLGLDGSTPESVGGTPPRTQAEEMLCDIFVDVLGGGPMGVDVDFFDAGGDSIQAVRIIARVGDAFGVRIPATILFESPTIGELAVAVLQVQAGDDSMQELLTRLEGLSEEDAAQLVSQPEGEGFS